MASPFFNSRFLETSQWRRVSHPRHEHPGAGFDIHVHSYGSRYGPRQEDCFRAERNDIHPRLLHILPARPHEAARGRHPGTDSFAYLARALACLGKAFGLTLKLAETDRSLHPRLSLSRSPPPIGRQAPGKSFPREVAARGRGVDNRGCEGEEGQLCVWSILGVEREGVTSLNAERRIPRSKARVYGREKLSMADEKSGRRRAATTTEEDEPTPLCPDQVPQPSLR